ncbi:peptidoglycan D,D-transpeptidase FtsI family protein [Aureimonas psammosilenae]|uniref:peptidoglycan D,D-transpeptidase FtsI family protein n=1 Tax=Aureimonas psammosilenae TaxID=2495496 RepID=UPI001F300F10|nr:penicillin-binding protein 2 [Aureimonas psammosilenae]
MIIISGIACQMPAKGKNQFGMPSRLHEGIGRGRRRPRFVVAAVGFAAAYAVIGIRLIQLGVASVPETAAVADRVKPSRPDIVDRNGVLLATDLKLASLYAEPRSILDADEVVEKLSTVLPDLPMAETHRRLRTERAFIWLDRHLTPSQQAMIHALGLPGIGFRPEVARIYPAGNQTSHILGLTNIDNHGISGMEKWIDQQGLTDLQSAGLGSAGELAPVRLSLDIRVQNVLHQELAKAMETYRAKAAGGVVLDARTGEIMAMVSLPDFDPLVPAEANERDRLNRIAAGTAEMGSTIKTFTTAMALEIGGATLNTLFDASRPLRVGHQSVRDPHSKGRPLSLEEVFRFSSNVGSAHEALMVGVDAHRDFLRRAGLLDRLRTELPETAQPIQPRTWSQATSITASFGHGFATTPLQTAAGIAAVLNGGNLIPPTFLTRSREEANGLATRIVSERTSAAMRFLYRDNAVRGSGRRANIDELRVGGKTGTAEKVVDGRYSRDHNFNAFAAALPMDDPEYVYLVVVDDPRPERPGMGSTAASNAAPVAGAIIARTALMLGVRPSFGRVADAEVTAVPAPRLSDR